LTEIPVDSAIPLDVDTWDDYERLLASAATSVLK
jgi:CTP:molybdopterin cytidylyltransferase MocA